MSGPPSASRQRVKAVIVNFNAGEWLRRSVDALLASDLDAALELEIFDNASEDNSLESLDALASDGLLSIHRNPDNLGFASACNQALAASEADWLLVVNPDCVVAPDAVARMLETGLGDPKAGIVGALIHDPDGGEQRACRRRRPTPARSIVTLLGLETSGREGVNIRDPLPTGPVELEAVSGALMLIRRACFRDLGGFDGDYFLHCEDLDLFERARKAGWRVLFEPRARAEHAKGVTQQSVPLRSAWHKHRGMVRYFRRHLAADVPPWQARLWPAAIWLRFLVSLPLLLWRQWISPDPR